MSAADRAKQFMPFSALGGLAAALSAKEKIYLQKKEVADDTAVEIDRILRKLQVGMTARITYFCRGEYVDVRGEVLEYDLKKRRIRLDGREISFDDIYRVCVLEKKIV